jgi:fucose 4-O-acetylase-like acetyltransferase
MIDKKRDTYVDFFRGIAMLLVVLGHTMSGVTNNSQSSFLFNIVWSLQMPMFFLISGYVTRYSRKCNNAKALLKLLGRRTLMYLLPWFVWTVLIRGILLGHIDLSNFSSLFWNMDSGYWFLISIWCISVIFSVSSLIAEKLIKSGKTLRIILVTALFFLLGFCVLAAIGIVFGLSFFCIKLTLYYMPFYFFGFVYGCYKDKITNSKKAENICNIVVALSVAVWICLMVRFSLFELQDNLSGIVLRVSASIAGCVSVFGLLKFAAQSTNKVCTFITRCGKHTLEIYLTHYCFLCLIRTVPKPDFSSLQGVALVFVNYILTVSITVICVKLFTSNKYLNLILFGKYQGLKRN